MDEAISSVVAICDTTPERAAQYVQLADGDAGQAIQLFFENNGVDLAAGQSGSPTTARTAGAGNAQNPINIDDEEEESTMSATRHAPVEDDEAMARRLQQEMFGGDGGDEENTLRAPISRQAETLLGPGADSLPYTGAGMDPDIQERLHSFQTRRGTGFRPGIFNQAQPTSHIWSGDAAAAALSEATGGASEGSARNGMLARLYQPPWELMFKGSWEDARDLGKDEKKWLLVNIQDASIFDCQVLNRDLWKNEGIAETISENFVFLQYSKDDVRADQYVQYYFHDHENTDAYPHVAIVDPRTGEQIKLWSRNIPKAPDFLMQIHEFLDRYSLEAGARNPVAKRRAEAKKTFDQMTEEEQLQQALQASLASKEDTPTHPDEDPDDLTRSIGDLSKIKDVAEQKADAMSIYEKDEPAVIGSPFSQIASNRPHTEPAAGPNVTRVQIRHPAGRVVHRFDVSDPVERIYEYLKAEPLEGTAGKEFELVAMGKNLMESREQSIEAAGLKNGTIMVEFLDD